MDKEIYNKNDKNRMHGLHGYQEWYGNNKLWLRCNYKNGQPYGYYENHLNDWNPQITRFFIK